MIKDSNVVIWLNAKKLQRQISNILIDNSQQFGYAYVQQCFCTENNGVEKLGCQRRNKLLGPKRPDGQICFNRFSANITRIWINGTEIKSYQVENFRQLPYESVDLDGNISASFGGVSDIRLDNEFMWENVSTTIAINHSLAMSLTLDDNATDNQFTAQPIYGLVNRLVERKEMRFE